jgi:hypothetical protein
MDNALREEIIVSAGLFPLAGLHTALCNKISLSCHSSSLMTFLTFSRKKGPLSPFHEALHLLLYALLFHASLSI